MMTFNYAECDVILVDHDLNARQSIKNILHNQGFRMLRVGQTLSDLASFMTKGTPDLVIGSCDLKDGDFIDYVRNTRQGRIGSNPFLAFITLVSEPTPELVGRIVESGTDAVIAKPFSTGQVLDRISDLISVRKKFIISDSYMGPIRRKDGGTPGVVAPNTLKARASGRDLSYTEIEAMIAQANNDLKTIKVDVIGAQIADHVMKLVPMLERGLRVNPAMRSELLALLDITDAAEEKLSGTQFEHVSDLCNSLGNVASSILASRAGDPVTTDMRLLKPLSQAIQACFSGAITDVDQVRAISAKIGVV